MTRLAAAAAVCALALAQAPATLAVIQIDRGISGVRIPNTGAQVRAALGNPPNSRAGSSDFGRFVEHGYNTTILPPGRSARKERIDSAPPNPSSTTSTPSPPVSSRTRARKSSLR
jgi:hypothetical protein